MKQCPQCKTTYNDDSLSFCLSDGNPLVNAVDEEQTVVRKDALRVDLSPKTERIVVPKTESHESASASTWIKVAIAVVVLGIAAIGVLGLVGVVFYYNTGGSTPTPTPVPPTPTPTTTVTPDIERERLQDEIANIRRQLEEQKKNANVPDEDQDIDEGNRATVYSPNDGFLALRSAPDADRGERLAKIPHGAMVEILRCSNSRVTIGGRDGRWCYVEYNGVTGWVFDAWLAY